MRALLLFLALLLLSLVLPGQKIQLHQLAKLPVENHETDAAYLAGDVVKTSGGILYRALNPTSTNPPSADWEIYLSGEDRNGILDGGIDTVANTGWWAFPLNPDADAYGRFSIGRQQNSNSFASGPAYTAAGGEQAAFFFTVDSLGNYVNGEFVFNDGLNTTRYRPGSMFFQGSSAPFGHTLSFTSNGMQFSATLTGSPYIAMPTAGPGASTNGRVRVTDGAGATTWEDYTPPEDITDDQAISRSNDTIFLEDGGFVVLPSGGGSSSETPNVASVNQSQINPNAIWKKVASKEYGGYGLKKNTPLSGGAATYRGKHNRTYFTWNGDTNIEAFVAYYDHDQKTFSEPVSWGVPRPGAADDHAYPELTVTPKGHILLVQEELDGTTTSNHNTPHWFRRSTNPEDITSYVEDGPLIVHGSYPNLTVVGDTIHYTQRFSRDVSTEHHVIGYMLSTDDGDNWERWDGTTVNDATDSMDIVVDIGPNNYWAYSWDMQGDNFMYKIITLVNRVPNFNYPSSYILFTKDGRTWGNYEWFIGASSGAWSKDVPSTSYINLAELNTNALVAGDATIDQDSSNIVYDAAIVGDELHYVWGKGLRGTGNNVWSDFVYTIVQPDGTKNDYSLVAGNALATDVDQLNFGQIMASEGQIMVKLLNADDGTINVVTSNNGGKDWLLTDTYGTIDSDPVKSVTAHGDRTNTDYSQGVAVHNSSTPDGIRIDIYELVGSGNNLVATTEIDAGGTYAIDWKHNRDLSIELTANSTLNFKNVGEGEPGTIRVVQDGGGSNSLTLNFYSDDLATLLSSKRVGPYSSIDFTGGNTTAVKYERIGDVVVYEYVQESTISGGGGGATELNDLTDVNTTGEANGDVLTYNSSTGNYEPVAPSGGGSNDFIGFRAEGRTVQTFPNNSYAKMNFTYEEFDTEGWFNPATDIFQPQQAGYYMVTAGIVFAAIGEGDKTIIEIRKNGSRYAILSRGTGSTGTPISGISGSDIVYMNGTTDQLEIHALTNSSNTNTLATDGYNRFAAYLIGE